MHDLPCYKNTGYIAVNVPQKNIGVKYDSRDLPVGDREQ